MFSLTHPQRRIVVNQQIYEKSKFAYMYGFVHIEDQTSVKIKEAINSAINFFDCLRIRFKNNENEICQYIYELQIENIELKSSTFDFSKESFGLFNEKLYRFYIIEENDKVLGYYFIFHHSIVDAYTITLITKYIEDFLLLEIDNYTHRSFCDFLEAEKQYLHSEQFSKDDGFFINRIKNSKSFQYISEFDLRCKRIERSFTRDQSDIMLSFCKKKQISIFKLVYASVFLLLYLENNKTSQTISTTHHNRNTDELLQTGGMFVSTIPIVQKINTKSTFSAFLENVSKNISESLARHPYPIDLLLNKLMKNESSNLALTEVILSSIPFGSTNYKIQRYSPNEDIAKLNFKLNPHSKPKGSNIELALDFRTSCYSQFRAEQMLEKVVEIVFMIIDREDEIISSVLNSPNDIMITLQKVFLNNPIKTALIDENLSLTYEQLNDYTNAVAYALQEEGQIIGVVNKRSVWYVVAILGILKAGRAFAVLDPELQGERINSIIKQAHIKKVLSFDDELYDWIGVEIVNIYKLEFCNKDFIVEVGDLAYILFTSGSTGIPKGVLVSRKGLLSLIKAMKEYYKIEGDNRFLAYCHFNFDVSIAEIFLSLFTASTLFMANDEQRHNLQALHTFLLEKKIDNVFLPTKVGEMFIKYFPNCPIKNLTIGGEKMSFYQKTNYNVFNGYGPTEFTVFSHIEKIESEAKRYSIGSPLNGVSELIADSNGNPSNVGELILIGEQAAFGYLNNYADTQKSFMNDSYKTGDRVERDENGKLFFLSRLDRQIKYNGFRIELDEIECVTECSGLVYGAVCIFDNNEIILNVSPKENYRKENLEQLLRNKLPPYAIPKKIYETNDFPINKIGKTEKSTAINNQNQIKLTVNEKKLLKIFKLFIKNQAFDVSENIHNAGIDSLDILQIMIQVEQKCKHSLHFSDFFMYPTIQKLAFCIESKKVNGYVVKIREGKGRPLVVIFDMSGDVIAYQNLIMALNADIPIVSVSSTFIPPGISLEEYTNFLVDQLLEQGDFEGYDLVGYSSGGIIALEIAKQLKEKANNLFLIDVPNYKAYPERIDKLIFLLWENVSSILSLYGIRQSTAYALRRFKLLLEKRSIIDEQKKLRKMIKQYEIHNPHKTTVLFASAKMSKITDKNLGWEAFIPNEKFVYLEGNHISIMKKEATIQISKIIEEQRRKT